MKKSKISVFAPIISATALSSLPINVSCSQSKNYTKEFLDEFLGNNELEINGLISVPRPSYYHDRIIPYLKQRIKTICDINENQVHVDNASNLYFDVPASKGFENKDVIILQGHTDMVVAGMSEEDAKILPIDAIIDGNTIHSRDNKTSIGADNGAGISSAFTILKNINNLKHGPIRIMLTADEDAGMIGASQVSKEWFKYNDNWIKWLINIDSENVNYIQRSCFGNTRAIYSKSYDLVSNEDLLPNQYVLSIDGLKGGHSGANIGYRANADRMAYELLYNLLQKGKKVQLISHTHTKQDGNDEKFSSNQIINHCVITFASDFDGDKDSLLSSCVDDWKNKYSDENWQQVIDKINFEKTTTNANFINQDNSEKIINFFGNTNIDLSKENLTGLCYGVLKWDGDSMRATSNIGPISINLSNDKNKIDLLAWTSSRSGIGSPTTSEKFSIKWFMQQYEALANNFSIFYEQNQVYYPWIKDENNELVKMLLDGYNQLGVHASPYDGNGGVEPSWWTQISEGNTVCACVGPTIKNAHSINETLYIDTIEPVIKNIIGVIEKIAKMN